MMKRVHMTDAASQPNRTMCLLITSPPTPANNMNTHTHTQTHRESPQHTPLLCQHHQIFICSSALFFWMIEFPDVMSSFLCVCPCLSPLVCLLLLQAEASWVFVGFCPWLLRLSDPFSFALSEATGMADRANVRRSAVRMKSGNMHVKHKRLFCPCTLNRCNMSVL